MERAPNTQGSGPLSRACQPAVPARGAAANSSRRAGQRLLVLVLVLLQFGAILWHGRSAAAAEPPVAKEYQIKAAFLYNFTKFVEWPEAKFAATNSPIVVGVLGRNPFGAALAETVRDRKVNGREVQVRQVSTVAEVKGLHVLFLGAAEPNQFEVLEAAVKEGAVLGVGESETFLQRGGTIRFVIEEDKVRFEVDLKSAERAQLKISSQLLRLARVVKPKS